MTSADGQATLRATGQVIQFDGFLKLYTESRDDLDSVKDKANAESSEDDSRRLPAMTQGENTDLGKVTPDQHFTEPPPRYTEATLVKKMEELGIGRPSTYASILEVLRARTYVVMDRNRFVPEDKGRLVIAFLESFFKRYVEYDFTADLEQKLDLVSSGDLKWKSLLTEFWTAFIGKVDEIKDLRVTHVLDALNEILGPHIFPAHEDGSPARSCPSCDDGELSLKIGRFGAFVGCSNYPECKFTRQFSANGDDATANLSNDPKVLGTDPASGEEVTMRTGRFGPYVQLGEGSKEDKPKRASIPKEFLEDFDLERALALINLPREVGPHPEDGEMISAGIGRYGPFVLFWLKRNQGLPAAKPKR
jgi:DNA topoisomerase-1